MAQVEILGVPVSCMNLAELLAQVFAWSAGNTLRTVTYVNAHCLNLAWSDRDYHHLLNNADLVYSDGVSVVWSSKLLGGCQLTKMTGAQWIEDFCEQAQIQGTQLYLFGGAPGISENASKRMLARYPALKIMGYADGFYKEKDEAQIIHEISSQEVDVVFVGLGSPVQEKWINSHRQELAAPVIWAVGAMFDYVAGLEQRAPEWMVGLGLEWMWRMLLDPVGKWQRYIFGNPLFAYRIIRQWMKGKINTHRED